MSGGIIYHIHNATIHGGGSEVSLLDENGEHLVNTTHTRKLKALSITDDFNKGIHPDYQERWKETRFKGWYWFERKSADEIASMYDHSSFTANQLNELQNTFTEWFSQHVTDGQTCVYNTKLHGAHCKALGAMGLGKDTRFGLELNLSGLMVCANIGLFDQAIEETALAVAQKRFSEYVKGKMPDVLAILNRQYPDTFEADDYSDFNIRHKQNFKIRARRNKVSVNAHVLHFDVSTDDLETFKRQLDQVAFAATYISNLSSVDDFYKPILDEYRQRYSGLNWLREPFSDVG